MIEFTLTAHTRTRQGTSDSRRLRHAGRIPAVIYGQDKSPISISLDHDQVFHMTEIDGFHEAIIHIDIDGKQEKAKFQAIQRHPFKKKLMHVDFLRT